MTGKQRFLAVYDYGQGGVWALINANSAQEIQTKYPCLAVLEQRPAWMTDDVYKKIESISSFDIDGAPPDWLAMTLENKK